MPNEEPLYENSVAEIKEMISSMQNQLNEQNKRLLEMQGRLFLLEDKDTKQNKKSSSSIVNQEVNDYLAEKSNATPPPPPPPPDYSALAKLNESPAEKAQESKSLEEMIAGGLFTKIGIVVLLIGAALFLKYAFDNNWIGPTGRVIIGLIAGMALLFLGERFIRKYFSYAQIITGGGLSILFLSIYSAQHFYQLIPAPVAFIAFIIITAIGIVLSLRYNALPLMIATILGGFATPILASTGQNNLIVLFSYILILDLSVLAVSVFKRWHKLNFIAFIGTIIIYSGWHVSYYSHDQLLPVMIFLTLFFFVYSLSSLIYNLVKQEISTGTEQILTMITGVSYFSISYLLLNSDYHVFMGFFAIVMAIYYFLWAYVVKKITKDDENLYNFLALLTVGFVTVAIPIQFKQNLITISWAIEAVILFWLAGQTKEKAIYYFAGFISSLTLVKLIFIDATRYLPDYIFLLNRRFFTFFVVIIASYLIAFIIRVYLKTENNDKDHVVKYMVASLVVANLLTIGSISQEISSYYEQKATDINNQISKQINDYNLTNRASNNGQYLFSGSGYYSSEEYKEMQNQLTALRNRSSIVLSLFWLFYSIILLIIGFMGNYKMVRLGGIALLTMAILKLFFYDLWSLGKLYRIISSVSLGIVLLAISFAYQKYKDKIKEQLI